MPTRKASEFFLVIMFNAWQSASKLNDPRPFMSGFFSLLKHTSLVINRQEDERQVRTSMRLPLTLGRALLSMKPNKTADNSQEREGAGGSDSRNVDGKDDGHCVGSLDDWEKLVSVFFDSFYADGSPEAFIPLLKSIIEHKYSISYTVQVNVPAAVLVFCVFGSSILTLTLSSNGKCFDCIDRPACQFCRVSQNDLLLFVRLLQKQGRRC